MKTEVWVYTVYDEAYPEIIFWQGVFDCEVSDARVKATCFPSSSHTDNIIIRSQKRVFFREKRDPVSIIPEIQLGILFSLERNMQSEGWLLNELTKLSLNQPTLYACLQKFQINHGEITALMGVIVYKLIESQIEADQC